ncbi:hypothetical protein EGW08_008408 [Elysia chlorotica]|uniref:CUB domain-containing protein n=1 Tax=Elysia chlorotica TaxID=188477 RepID=A0A433TQI9_ELYCH|nr:hypothetical protein EGW08_008408 [Elysia chlorotica]
MASDEATTQVLPKLARFVFTLLWLKSVQLPTISCETVYFDKYGHCQRSWKPFDLDDDVYTLKSTGGNDAYNSMKCSMTFRAPSEYGICLTFKDVKITRCDVTIEIHNSKSDGNTEPAWYGHCQRSWKPFDLDDDVYTLKSTGGNDAYNSMKCSMTFRAPSEYGICLTFKDVKITRCDVTIEIHNSKSDGNTEPAWRTLSCYEDVPSPMCTSNRYVTVTVSKTRFSHYDGYEFEIEVEKNHAIGDWLPRQQEDTWGLTSPNILGNSLTSSSELDRGRTQDNGARDLTPNRGSAQPDMAPPVDEIYRPNEVTPVLAPDHQSSQDLPPPYVLPPPYEEEYSTSSAPPLHQENSGTSPVE